MSGWCSLFVYLLVYKNADNVGLELHSEFKHYVPNILLPEQNTIVILRCAY